MKKIPLAFASAALLSSAAYAALPESVDLLVVGGGASGVTAGVQAARMGTNTLIIEEQPWLGGMLTSAGVTCTDGNYNMKGGLWGEFLKALADYYGGFDALKTGWVSNVQFEPHVGEQIFRKMVKAEDNLQVENNVMIIAIGRDRGRWIATVRDNDGKLKNIEARMVIDATELGDVAKMAGVRYDIGMESRNVTHEDIAPEYANNIIQDLTWVATLKDFGKDVTIPRPASYNREDYACCSFNDLCTDPKEPDRMRVPDVMITYGKLPNNKYMINWPVSGNDYYTNVIELDREGREAEFAKAREFTLGFIYFLQTELGFNNLAPADDEYPTDDRLALIPYHRESRRIHGLVRYDLNDMTDPYGQPDALYRTGIAVGDYPVDHHHARYNGADSLPNLFFHAVPSFNLPMGTLIPKDVDDLIVAEKSISVSNIVNGATRLQPVVLQIGQAAGAIASLALAQGKDVKDVKVRDVQRVILDAGGYILPYLDVKNDHSLFRPLQRIGATGLLHSTSKRVDWSNQTWLNINNPLLASDLKRLYEFYDMTSPYEGSAEMTVADALDAVKAIAEVQGYNVKKIAATVRQLWKKHNFGKFNRKAKINRGQYAAIVDEILDPFDTREVTITGMFEN